MIGHRTKGTRIVFFGGGGGNEQKLNSAKTKKQRKRGRGGRFSSTLQTRAEDPVLKTQGPKRVNHNKKIKSKSTHKNPSHKVKWERRMGMVEQRGS